MSEMLYIKGYSLQPFPYQQNDGYNLDFHQWRTGSVNNGMGTHWSITINKGDSTVCTIMGKSLRDTVSWKSQGTYNTNYQYVCLFVFLKRSYGTSLVVQWLRICLPMQGTRVRALVWEDPTCRGATRPMSHNYWACASGACAPQQERPQQWEARAPRWRVAPTRRN